MPAEKTFPQGFEYVLMGVIKGQGEMKIEAVTNQLHLGDATAQSADAMGLVWCTTAFHR